MPLEVVYGESRERDLARLLASELRRVVADGTVYLGYPVLVTADDRVNIDALLVSRDHGLVAFLFDHDTPRSKHQWERATAEQDKLYSVLDASLRRHERLRSGRTLLVTPQTATIFPDSVDSDDGLDGFFGTLSEVGSWIDGLEPLEASVEQALQAALQRVSTIKPAKRRAAVQRTQSRGAILKTIERSIANLDRWQKAAAIESPDGPQRIRGLAGSGKTVVLALKAAYLHSQHPDWNIAFTFQTRALYQQIVDLTTRFAFAQSDDRPDPEQLRIMHAWGSRSEPGVYSAIAASVGEDIRDWAYARGKFGMDDGFRGVCQELLDAIGDREVNPIFDAVLIDEAQDLPPEFFQLVYRFTHNPKRIVWGYDELQKLSEATMPDTDELFGRDDGVPLVQLGNAPDAPRMDIVLPVCYRNPPWTLATAHALGLGIYRGGGLIQHPDQPALWRDIGYRVVSGQLAKGKRVTLARSTESAPTYFGELITPADAVQVHAFGDEASQDEWVAEQIATNLQHDELEPDDILVVLPDTYRAKSRAPRLMKHLRRLGIESHLVGVNTSRDEVFVSGSVALAHIFRAKGNEAPMVYAIDSQFAADGVNLITKRNTLFTAITRSRAWVRITGYGAGMERLAAEAEAVTSRNYQLEFKVPTANELKKLRHIYRERTASEEESVRRASEALESAMEALDNGEIELEDLPLTLRRRIVRLMGSLKET